MWCRFLSEASTISNLGPRPRVTWLWPLTLVFSALLALSARADQAQLELKPQVCALSESEELCREQIDIEWRSGESLQVCLFIDGEQTPLACWYERRRGDYEYQAQTKESLTFELRQQPGDQLLAREILSVIREHTDYRYRRRKPWSFF